MTGNLIVTKDRFFHVYEVNGVKETEHANYLAKSTLKSPHGPIDVHAVFHDAGKVDPNKGRFFTKGHVAQILFRAVQGDIDQYCNPLLNGETLEQMQEWVDGLTHLQYQRITQPYVYSEGVVYREYAGIQVIADRSSFRLLELMGEEEELPLYEENHDGYFCIRVDLTEHQDENILAFLYVKNRLDLVTLMDKLLDTWINVEVVVSNVEMLTALMGLQQQDDV